MTPQQRSMLCHQYRDALLEDVVPFWLRHGVDRESGGVLTCLDRDGTLVDSDKSIWAQGRFGWMMGKLHNTVEARPEWLEQALSACRFLESHGFDRVDGRMWFHVTRDGRPIRKRRYAFSESFAALAFGEVARATSSDHYADLARRCFLAFVRHTSTPAKHTDVRPMKSIGQAMITINTAQELREAIALSDAEPWIDRAIDEIARDFINPEFECVLETVGPSGELIDHFDGRTVNPGHAIEAAWFILREGQIRQRQAWVEMGCRMLRWMWRRGWDDKYGGIYYFRDVRDQPVQEYWHDMKFWWPHCEALIATLMAYQSTGDPQFAEWHLQLHEWCEAHFRDREHGEWFGYLHRDGTLSSTLKGSLWKGPFHVPRMLYWCWQLLQEEPPAPASAAE